MKLKFQSFLWHLIIIGSVSLAAISLPGCSAKKKPATLFESLSADSTGIDFRNDIKTSDSLNIFSFEYIYNGGGVGIGDFNGDGLPDIFFGGNKVPGKLYINQGNFHFRDITASSQFHTAGNW